MADFEDNGYIDVATRIAEFREKYPEGSLSRLDPHGNIIPVEWREFGIGVTAADKDKPLGWVGVTAFAYRSPDDKNPGVGTAYERVPGLTPYTRNSEVQNAETSAWGRAIVAALAADTKVGVASLDEVKIRRAEQEERKAGESLGRKSPAERHVERAERAKAGGKTLGDLTALVKAQGRDIDEVKKFADAKFGDSPTDRKWIKDESKIADLIRALEAGEA